MAGSRVGRNPMVLDDVWSDLIGGNGVGRKTGRDPDGASASVVVANVLRPRKPVMPEDTTGRRVVAAVVWSNRCGA